MHPEPTTDPRVRELRALAQGIEDYRVERGLSVKKLLGTFKMLGSDKTWKLILNPDKSLEDLSVENQLENYRTATGLIDLRRKSDRPAERIYEDFDNVRDTLAAVARALQEDALGRVLCVIGETGCGKDVVKSVIAERWGAKIGMFCEANAFWYHSHGACVEAWMREYNRARNGNLKVTGFPKINYNALEAEIGEQQLILFVNEAHHMGVNGLNLLKSLINACPKLVVILAYIPSYLRALESSQFADAQQLFGNRLCERIELHPPTGDEILLMAKRRGLTFAADFPADRLVAALDKLAEESRFIGNWRHITLVLRECHAAASHGPLTEKQFIAARDKVGDRRKPKAPQAKNGRAA